MGLSMGRWDSRKSFYGLFRGRTRSNKERDNIQLDGKRVENEINEASCTWIGWWSAHLSALHLVTTASPAFLLISVPGNFPGWKALYTPYVRVCRECKSLKRGSEITGTVCLECQYPETPDCSLVVTGACVSACAHWWWTGTAASCWVRRKPDPNVGDTRGSKIATKGTRVSETISGETIQSWRWTLVWSSS